MFYYILIWLIKREAKEKQVYIVCMDMEGIVTPEIWIEFAEAVGIPELKRTTRDEPDYDKLMAFRMNLLNENGLGIKEIQDTISKMEPLPGAREFLDELRTFAQVTILSDTFTQFAMPLMQKLGYPTLICNELVIAPDGKITGYNMRTTGSTKLSAVKAFQSTGFDTIAIGDSFNDLEMIRQSQVGILFRTTEAIRNDNPDLPALETYDELLSIIKSKYSLT